MSAKKQVKELEKALKSEPGNLVLRLKLAAVLREVGRKDEAVSMYHSVAAAYHQQGRLAQAIAVCRSVLEIEPSHRETQALLVELDNAKQSSGAALPSVSTDPPLVATGPRNRSATRPPTSSRPPQSVPSLSRLTPVPPTPAPAPGQRNAPAEPPPLPPASSSGLRAISTPSIPQLSPLSTSEMDLIDPLPPPMPQRLPLPASPTPQPPGTRAPASSIGPPTTLEGLPRAPRPEPIGVQMTSPERPMARGQVTAPPPVGGPRGAPPPAVPPPLPAGAPHAPGRDDPGRAPAAGAAPAPRTISPAPPLRTITPAGQQPPPGPPADAPLVRPQRPTAQPPAKPVAPGPSAPVRPAPPGPRSAPPVAAKPPPPARPPGRPTGPQAVGTPPAGGAPAPRGAAPRTAASSPPPAGTRGTPRPTAPGLAQAPPAAPAPPAKPPTPLQRLSRSHNSVITPTPMSTPLPPPYPGTPTPADAPPISAIAPPYVPTPGQDDVGDTMPRVRARPAPAANPFDEATRIAEDAADLAPVQDARAARLEAVAAQLAADDDRTGDDATDAGEDNATRVAGDLGGDASDDEATHIADEPRELPPRRRASSTAPTPMPTPTPTSTPLTPMTPMPALTPGPTPSPTPTPVTAVTAAAAPSSVAATRRAPTADAIDDMATRVANLPGGGGTATDAGRPAALADFDDGPLLDDSRPALPGDLAPFQRGDRLLDVAWPAGEEPPGDVTDPGSPAARDRAGDTGDTNPGQTRRTTMPRVAKPGGGEVTGEHDDDGETSPLEKLEQLPDDGLELARAFDRSFGPDLGRLAPDGSTIEQPLPLFSRLSREAYAELQRRMSFRRCAAGDLVLREGDPGDACYVIHSGSVRVLKRDPSGSASEVIEIARLGPGALFGEFALLADRRRHASVQALEACELYEIPRRLLRELAAEYADVGPALERFYRERLLATLLATAPFFQSLPEEDRAGLMARFSPRRIEAGATIIREGEPGGGLYLVVLGTVDITRRAEGRRAVLLASLGEGAYFGEMSLLSGGRASATVTAAGPVELAQLSPRDFYEIVASHPVIWEELRQEAHRRELTNRNIMAGDTRMV